MTGGRLLGRLGAGVALAAAMTAATAQPLDRPAGEFDTSLNVFRGFEWKSGCSKPLPFLSRRSAAAEQLEAKRYLDCIVANARHDQAWAQKAIDAAASEELQTYAREVGLGLR